VSDRHHTVLVDLDDPEPPRRGRFGGIGPIGVALLVASLLALIGLGFVVSSLIPTGTDRGTVPLGLGGPPPVPAPTGDPSPTGNPSPTGTLASVPATAPASAGYRPTALEDEAVRLTNAARKQAGCPPVKMDGHLRTAAREHSADMVQKKYFSHTGSDGRGFQQRITDAGYKDPRSENIATGFPTAAAVMQAWLNSAGHKANIVDCDATSVGVGVARAANGTVLWTADFGA